jgi:two-component system, OmpR family, KDP operon response regulator KdpE
MPTTKARRTVLIIDDEPQLRRFLRAGFELAEFAVREAENAAEALAAITSKIPDLIILDLVLPDRGGAELLDQIRSWSNVPVIVLSARSDEDEKVYLLQRGADDYVTKPFGMSELLARSEAALRRYFKSPTESSVVEAGPLSVDLATRNVSLNEARANLTRKEYRLIELLATHLGNVVTHQQLLKEIWGAGYVHNVQYLRILVRKVRQKIEQDPARPEILVSESGVGYRLQPGTGKTRRSSKGQPAPAQKRRNADREK